MGSNRLLVAVKDIEQRKIVAKASKDYVLRKVPSYLSLQLKKYKIFDIYRFHNVWMHAEPGKMGDHYLRFLETMIKNHVIK